MRCIIFFIKVSLLIGFASCAINERVHYHYFQNTQQVPLFKEKNEFRLSGNLEIGKENNGYSFQGAYSLPQNLAIALSGMNFQNSRNTTLNGVSTGAWSGQSIDGALGQYYDFKEYGIFEIYGGYNYGVQQHSYSSIQDSYTSFWYGTFLSQTVTPIGTADFNSSAFYILPSYGYSFNGVDIAISTRYSYLNYSVVNKVDKGTKQYEEVKSIKTNPNYLLFEPALTFRGGWQYAKMQLQFAFTGGADYIRYSPYTISFGLQIAIAERFWRKKPEVTPELIE